MLGGLVAGAEGQARVRNASRAANMLAPVLPLKGRGMGSGQGPRAPFGRSCAVSFEVFRFSPEALHGVHAITLSRSARWKDDPAVKISEGEAQQPYQFRGLLGPKAESSLDEAKAG